MAVIVISPNTHKKLKDFSAKTGMMMQATADKAVSEYMANFLIDTKANNRKQRKVVSNGQRPGDF